MWDDLRIRYPGGRMVIHMDIFFPASIANVRKLYKIMEQSEDVDVDELVDRILRHMQDRDIRIEETARKAANDFARDKTEYEELKEQLRSGKQANGVPIPKDQRKIWRARLHRADEGWRGDKRYYDQLMRERKRLSQNKLLLLELNGRC